MVSAAAIGSSVDTQVLDIDSPAQGQMPTLYGETQTLDGFDSSDDEDDGGINEWGKTQLVDTYEETAVVDSSGEGTDCTEVLSGDEEGASDGGATSCGDGKIDGVVDSGAEMRMIGGDKLSTAQEKKDDVIDSNASTDDGGVDDDDDSGITRRSLGSVRAAAVRSSGLAAARCFAFRRSKSFSYCKHSETEDGSVDGPMDLEGIGISKITNNEKVLTSLTTQIDKLDAGPKVVALQRPTQNCFLAESKSRGSNRRVKRLFNELLPSEKDRNTGEDGNISKAVSAHLPSSDCTAAGLSYVVSQEPSDLSQANALGIVDKFLSINDMGSSQETKVADTDSLKSPIVLGTKVVQLLAERTDCRSPVGKQGAFDWNDNLEDEGGGAFFTKRKATLFEGTNGDRKTKSHPTKYAHAISGTTKDAIGKRGGQCANLKGSDGGNALVHSDSRLVVPNPITIERIHLSDVRKNLFVDANEVNFETSQHQLNASDAEGGLEGVYDVGPDTQMAAEAMEALTYGSLLNAEKETTHAAGNLIMDPSKSSITKSHSPMNVTLQKRASLDNENAIVTRSKSRKMLTTKSREGGPSLGRGVCSTSSKMKSGLDKTVKRQNKRGEGKLDGQEDIKSTLSRHFSPKFSEKERTKPMVESHLDEEQRPTNRTLVAKPLSYSNRHSKRVELEQQRRDSPIGVNTGLSCRTMHSKRLKSLQQNQIFLDGEGPCELIDPLASKAVEAVDNVVALKSGLLKEGLDPTGGIQNCSIQTKRLNCTPHGELLQTSSPTKYGSLYPKRKRTNHVASDNLNEKSSILGVHASEVTGESSKQGRRKEIFIRSISDILDEVKRKKRSTITHMPLQSDKEPSSLKVVKMIYGSKTRSSLESPSLKPSDEVSITPNDANFKNPSFQIEKAEPKRLGSEHAENAENDKLYVSPEGNVQQYKSTAPSKVTADLSPVCTAKDPPSTLRNKVVSTFLGSRELRKLEDTIEASTAMLKDTRKRKDMASLRILFSHHLDEDTIKQQKKILTRLGLRVAASILDATHFVTDKFVRTQNMLEAIAAGKPVVTPMWLESCGQASCFMDEKKYILRDSKKEREIGFNLPLSLARACQYPLLQGKIVFITPNVKPSRDLISSLVKASHGQVIKRIGRSAMKLEKEPDDLLVISCEEDYSTCIPLLEKGVGIYSSELLLNGIVIQKLEYGRHRLFSDHVKQTRSTIWLRHKDQDQFFPEFLEKITSEIHVQNSGNAIMLTGEPKLDSFCQQN